MAQASREEAGGCGRGRWRGLEVAALALLPLALGTWAAWLLFLARDWGVGNPASHRLALQMARYFLALTLVTLGGSALGTGWRGWGAGLWAALGLPLLAGASFATVPVVGHGGQVVDFAVRWGLAFWAAGIALAIAAGFRRGRGALMLRRAVAAASIALFLAALATGAWRALSPVEQLGEARLEVMRAWIGYRPVLLCLDGPGRERRALLANERGDLIAVDGARRPWLARWQASLPAPTPAEVAAALGPDWRLVEPHSFYFLATLPAVPGAPAAPGPPGAPAAGDVLQVAYEVQAMRPLDANSWGGGTVVVIARLDVDHARVVGYTMLPPDAERPAEGSARSSDAAGPFTIQLQPGRSAEVGGPGVLTRVHVRSPADWSWVAAGGRLAVAATEGGQLAVVLLPES